jgi:hypothetical protein
MLKRLNIPHGGSGGRIRSRSPPSRNSAYSLSFFIDLPRSPLIQREECRTMRRTRDQVLDHPEDIKHELELLDLRFWSQPHRISKVFRLNLCLLVSS